MRSEQKRTWAEISLGAIERNVREFRKKIPEGCRLCGVVKANAYGHGAVRVAKALEKLSCDYLAVATLDEAEELRAAGIGLPILIMAYTPPEFTERIIRADCIQAVGSPDAAAAYSRALEASGQSLRVHIKLETGMGRTGFNVKGGDISPVVNALALPGICAEGVFSHFAAADDMAQDSYTLRQLELFIDSAEKIEKETGKKFVIKHCANSAGMISYSIACLDMVRSGIALYGVDPTRNPGKFELSPAMELKTRVIEISRIHAGDSVSYGRTFTAERDMTVAVLPIGYADGLFRVLSGKTDVLIRGKRCPQVGRICMDMCMADVSGVEDIAVGDLAVVFGRDGDEFISVTELAEKAGTISYEMLSAVSPRVPRVYVE